MKKQAPWLAAAVILTIIFATLYGAVQQSLRLGANDPQIQLAEDAANRLNDGSSPKDVSSGHIDMGSSLAPFVVVYNKQGQALAGSGYLAGSLPTIPLSVLMSAHSGHDNTVTWQPQGSLRFASVEVAADNYYVLSGRSLREVEKRETEIMDIAALGWFMSLLAIAVSYWLTTVPKTRS